MGRVTKLPATINPLTQAEIGSNVKRKVAAYARVSTDQDEQYTSLTDYTECNNVIEEANAEVEIVNELLNKEIEVNSKIAVNQTDAMKKHEILIKRYKDAKAKIEEATIEKSEKRAKALRINNFINELKNQESIITEWSKELWLVMIERAIVNNDNTISFEFKNGKEIRI